MGKSKGVLVVHIGSSTWVRMRAKAKAVVVSTVRRTRGVDRHCYLNVVDVIINIVVTSRVRR